MRDRIFLKIIAVGCILVGASALAQDRTTPQSREQVMLSYAPIVKQVSPAVVNVYTKRVVTRQYSPFMNDPFFNRFFGQSFGGLSKQQVESSLGSGVIVEADGLAVTNAHVVKGASEISVVLKDGREYDASVSLVDEPSDLAVLRLDTDGDILPFASLKPSDSLEVGDIVLAIGNPFGVGQTVTSGIVSALARSSLSVNDFNFFIQTDAAINPGNSGGPLVSMDGGVIGINSAIYSRDGGSLGIGFAIPSEMVTTVLAAEKSGVVVGRGGVARPWIGVSGQAVTADIADSLGLTRPAGVLISSLHPASPAKKAGLQQGDVVTAINGKEVHDPAEMKFRLATVPLGEKATMKFLRKGKSNVITIVAMTPPENPPRNETRLEGAHPLNGVTVAQINPAVAVELGLDKEEGVVVMEVTPRSQASRLVRPGDAVLSINQDDIKDVKALQKALKKAESMRGWAFVIERGGQKTQVVVR
jgi:Do/DeqQ family serine protease